MKPKNSSRPDPNPPAQPYPGPEKKRRGWIAPVSITLVILLIAGYLLAFWWFELIPSQNRQIMADLERALNEQEALRMDQGYTFQDKFGCELEVLEKYAEASCWDKRMEELIRGYVDALQTQKRILDDGEYTAKIQQWHSANGTRCDMVEALYREYGFLADDQALLRHYLGRGETFRARGSLLHAINEQLRFAATEVDEGGHHYHIFTNSTPYRFTLTLDYTFRDAQGNAVHAVSDDVYTVHPNGRVWIYYDLPDDGTAWANLDITGAVSDISLDGTMLLP